MKRKLPKLISINILILLLFCSVVEILLGKWLENFLGNRNFKQIPNLNKNIVLTYDARWLYGSRKKSNIYYTRDKLGYRSRNPFPKKPIVLTIGGSTTDQRYVTDGETWQDYLDIAIPNYDFINGGVDGQSSYGHLKSIREWHSKSLNEKNISAIIYYIGLNDRELINNKWTNSDFAKTSIRYIKNLMKDNSFFISKILLIRNRIYFHLNTARESIDNPLNSHKRRTTEFLGKGIRYELKEEIDLSNHLNYKEIFSNLIIETRKNFPSSRIIIIQQQIPGCNFISKEIVLDRHPSKSIVYNKYQLGSDHCSHLLKVYNIQNKIIEKSSFKEDIKVFPMYLQKLIKDEDVYDYVHTNRSGSKVISEYIKSIMIKL